MVFFRETILLNNDEIISAKDRAYLAFKNVAKKRENPRANIELALEEMLLGFQSAYGTDAECEIIGRKSILGTIRFEFNHHGKRIDPLDEVGEEMNFSRIILQRFCNSPKYTYSERRRENSVTFGAPLKPKKNRMLISILIAIAVAVLFRLLIGLLPDNTGTFVSENIIDPIFNKMTAIISEIATPLVFLSVITGIVGLGSSAAIGSIGKKLLKNMMLTYLVAATAFSVLAFAFYGFTSGASTLGEGVVGQLVTLVLDMIPSNLFACFTSGNDLQVIMLSIFIGFVLLALGKVSEELMDVLNFISDVVNKMMLIACKLLPFIVFAGVSQLLLTDISTLSNLYKMVILFLLSSLIIIASLWIRTFVKLKVSPFRLFKYQLETFMINLTTSSQVAAMPSNAKCCKEDFGISPKMVDFALPIGIVTYMPNGAAFIGLLAWALADISGAPVDLTFIIKVAIVSVIIAIAAPPIPGSALVVMPILFSSCGIDARYYSIAIIIGTILGYFLPVLNGYSMQLELYITGKELYMIDEEKLERIKKQSQ